MARVLAQGTGAEWSQVWLVVADRPTLAATWPPGTPVVVGEDPLDETVPGRRSQAVHHGGELLGVLVVQERDQVRLTSVEERLFAGLASQAGLVLRGARLRAELEKRAAELSARAEELRRSTQRLVDAQDERRRALERDIHDGAQQHLVALAVNLRLAQTLADGAPDRAERLIAGQEKAAVDAVETLLQLARGIYPRLLEAAGVAAAVRAAVGSAGVEVEITEEGVDRYAADVEAAAYFCCLEALQNAAKHAGVTQVRVTLRGKPGSLEVIVQDDGGGFDPATTPTGSGLVNMRDRVESIGGTLVADSEPGGGTCIAATLPAPAVSPVGGWG
jgi:signal transduction histidine kinase